MKTFLKIVLAVVILVFVIISFKQKSREQTTQVEYSESRTVNTDIVETQTQRMMNVNSMAEGMMSDAETSSNIQSSSSGQSLSQNQQDREETLHLIVTGTYGINPGKYFGCVNRENFQDLVKLASQTDTRKFDKLMKKGLANGDCTYFERNEKVVLNEIGSDKKEIRVNRFGESQSYWTSVDAIK